MTHHKVSFFSQKPSLGGVVIDSSRRFIASACIASLLALVSSSQAALLTSDAGYTGPSLDLSDYATGDYNATYGPAPIPGGITFTSNVIDANFPEEGSVLGQGGYGLGANGNFGGDAVYAGLDGPRGYMSFILSAPVFSFGAYINYAPGTGDDPTIGAYDDNGVLLEEWNLSASAPISTPGGFNQFQFRGIILDTASITEFRLSGSFIIAAASANGNAIPPVVTPPATGVPDSGSSLLMFGAVFMGLVAFRNRSRT